MQYLVRLTDRAQRDLKSIYEFVERTSIESAFGWFNDLEQAVYSLERYPERGRVIPENKKLRHLLFGKKPTVYRIIYAVDNHRLVVNIVHIRHGARSALRRPRTP